MKLVCFILVLAGSLWVLRPTTTPEKYALIVAVGKYKWWNNLSSANDLALMQQTLQRQGFHSENIFIVRDAQATKAGIKKAFEDLTSRVPTGSIVVCHFSGHGQQISDDNGDEADGLDEALIPYDAPMSLDQKTGYDGGLHLRDDELGEWVSRLRAKLGDKGHVLLLLDSCHSGSATRGSAKVRGGAAPLLLPNARTTTSVAENGSGFFEGKSRGEVSKGLANYVVISGAKANEENRESKDASGLPVGSLTYAVSQTWANLNGSQINYYEWFGRIMNSMAAIVPYQTPTIEGDSEAALLSGDYVKIKPYFNVLAVLKDNEIRLDAGQLMGIFKGSKIALYGKGEAPVATGEVTVSNALLALVKLDKKLPPTALPKEYRVYVTEQTFGDLNVRLKVETSDKTLLDSLRAVPYIELAKTEPIDLILRNTPDGFQLYTAAEGLPFGKVQKNGTDCAEQVRNYVQTKILRTVDLIADSSMNIGLTVVPLEIVDDKLTGQQTTKKTGYPLGDIPSFQTGMQADFILENTGSSTLFVTGVDIMPNGLVSVLFPTPNEQPIDYKIDAGKSKTIRLKFGPPFGTETIKLYATSNAIDLRPIILTRGQDRSRSGPPHPIEQFFRRSYLRTRAVTVDPPPVQSGRVLAFTFQMIE